LEPDLRLRQKGEEERDFPLAISRRFQFGRLIKMGWRRAMADGCEEREEQEKRRALERRRDLEDRLARIQDRVPIDPWEPERDES
jgi:hypothetical protein